ncbi:MAG: PilZ domain-containing protein [Capsulimonadaceae bacterium]
MWPIIAEGYETIPTAAQGMHVAFIDNMSLNGLSFQSQYSYPVDTSVWIRLRVGSKTCQLKGVVRRVSTVVNAGSRNYHCGIQFVRSQQTTHGQAVVAGYFDQQRYYSHNQVHA